MIVLATFVALTLASSPDEMLARVQAAYKKAGTVAAAFEQTSVDALRGKKRTERGHLWAKPDGRVRWSYEQPAPKDFVYDGKSAYFYEPENAQVTVFDNIEDSPLWTAVRFLWGQGAITETFLAKACNDTCAKPNAGEVLLLLVPKKPIASVDHVVLGVDDKTGLVLRSTVYDSLGNRTEYRFSDINLHAKVDGAKFVFPMPKGVSILRASQDGR